MRLCDLISAVRCGTSALEVWEEYPRRKIVEDACSADDFIKSETYLNLCWRKVEWINAEKGKVIAVIESIEEGEKT